MPLSIKARCFNGKAYDLSFDGVAPTVSDLQQSISTASGIIPDRQTILFKGQVLDASTPLSAYPVTSGSSVNVVRRIGKTPTASANSSVSHANATSTSKPAVADAVPPSMFSGANSDSAMDGGALQPPSLEEMMRSFNLAGANAAGAGAGGGDGGPIPGLASMLSGAAGGAGGGTTGMGTPGNMEQLFSQLPQMMNGLLNTPQFKDYLNNTEKQEQSREAILGSSFMQSILESDPEFANVVNDPEKWRASMEAAKSLIPEGDGTGNDEDAATAAAAAAGMGGAETGTRGLAEGKSKVAAAAAARQSAAQIAPPGIDINKLSQSYGHALGQSLINSGLGLDPELVVKGLKTAVDGKAFPMSLPEYEREMATLQNIASEYLKKVNLEDANQFFEEIRGEGTATVLEEGKIAYETSEVEAGPDAAVAKQDATVLVIVSARLLDGRHFFTCPAADGKGDSVHPLTLPLPTAPRALTKGIVGMKENESRLLYIHPTACDGMTEMFGDLLPPNALLIFDLQLVSADAPEEETVGESYFSSA